MSDKQLVGPRGPPSLSGNVALGSSVQLGVTVGQMMSFSAEKRATDSKTITEKEGQKAGLEGDLEDAKASSKARPRRCAGWRGGDHALMLTVHCPWLGAEGGRSCGSGSNYPADVVPVGAAILGP